MRTGVNVSGDKTISWRVECDRWADDGEHCAIKAEGKDGTLTLSLTVRQARDLADTLGATLRLSVANVDAVDALEAVR